MPKKLLHEGLADKIEVPKGSRDVLVFDRDLPGFGIRKYADGKASYFIKYTINGKDRRHTLGPVRKGNLAQMRQLASEVKTRARLGHNVLGDWKTSARATVWELVVSTTVATTFHTSEADAKAAADKARGDGMTTRVRPIVMPADADRLADLLASYVANKR